MSLLRHTTILTASLLLAAAVGTARADDVSMAGGSIHFSTPSNWVDIMQTQGDPEVHVFQVPDPSPTGNDTLARVTVTVKQAQDLAAFNTYRDAATARARQLTDYRAMPLPGDDPNGYAYTARENGEQIDYIEYYWFINGRAVQLRCVRPAQSQAGKAWMMAFDKGCHQLAAELARNG